MKLQVDWGEPIPMRLASRQGSRYVANLEGAPVTSGVDGRVFEALCVGQARNLRTPLVPAGGTTAQFQAIACPRQAAAPQRVNIPIQTIRIPRLRWPNR
jgi:hypothetical protein